MSFVEEYWQKTRPTIRERTKFVFNNDRFSDIKFVVHNLDGESESNQVIPAHKFVLSISSPVFEAMFYGELAETKDSIELPDCDYESLLELFRFMYSDEVNLSGSNVIGVLYLAKKYMVPSLADKCTEYLLKNLDPSNVFIILPFAQKYEEKELVDRCWKVIDWETEEVVKSEGFVTIERPLLETVVIRDTLTIKEVDLFKTVDLWATKECERQGLEADGSNKRRILGEEIVKAIRFPTMTQKDFASEVLASDILTKEEIVSLVRYLNFVSSSPAGFPETKRCQNIHRCCRFLNTTKRCFYNGTEDNIDFSVDKDIKLHGVRFYGSEHSTYTINLMLSIKQTGLVLLSLKNKEVQTTGSVNFDSYGIEVPFDKEVVARKNTRYCITASVSGPPSAKGMDGFNSVQCSGVTFTFMDSSSLSSGTSVSTGQIPEILFSL